MTEEEIFEDEIVARTIQGLEASAEQSEHDEYLVSVGDFGSRGVLPSHNINSSEIAERFEDVAEGARPLGGLPRIGNGLARRQRELRQPVLDLLREGSDRRPAHRRPMVTLRSRSTCEI